MCKIKSRERGGGGGGSRKLDAGIEGGDKWIWLRLKLIADIGLVGLQMQANQLF